MYMYNNKDYELLFDVLYAGSWDENSISPGKSTFDVPQAGFTTMPEIPAARPDEF